MAIIKCKMCGGTLEIKDNESVAICEYCGTKQTLPKISSERRMNLYDRANHFRRNNDFDKAMNLYDQILEEDPSDAEAYWSLVLCRYGIEYVEDPASHKRIPTVNRAQFTSVFADVDYKAALEHADCAQREIYEHEAEIIDDIQKKILAISNKEEPFDVFICYKETDMAGRRTPDSVLATDLYHQLVNEGYKVFFSRITLEDKLGVEYEPYIFAALNSAKVMVVLGTKPEYFNAVWVKNEWSRYLALIKNGANKILIPAYRDMDPYDLPEEFGHLQAQDMGKLGFMQDLIRGIKKIVIKENDNASVIHSAEGAVAPLIERAFIFIEDSEWKNADEYCERVLDLEPRTAEAYVGKLMIKYRVSNLSDLADIDDDFEQDGNFQKALRFGNEKIRGELVKVASAAKERKENAEVDRIYKTKLSAFETADTEKELIYLAEAFESITGYKDADELAEKCRKKAEEVRIKNIYDEARGLMLIADIRKVLLAIEKFKEIPYYEDSQERIAACEKRIEELKIIGEKEKARKAENAKRNKKFAAIIAAMGAVAAVFIIVFITVIVPNKNYNNAVAFMEAGQYEKAIEKFEKLDGYKDSKEKIFECKYIIACGIMEEEKYEEAIAAFEEIKDYKDSAELIENCKTTIKEIAYQKAVRIMAGGDYEAAKQAFFELKGYKDSVEMGERCKEAIKEEKYQKALALFEEGKLDEAIAAFEEIKDYKDSAEQIETIKKEQKYLEAVSLMEQKKYKEAKKIFEEIKDYKDSAKKIKTCNNKLNASSSNTSSNTNVTSNVVPNFNPGAINQNGASTPDKFSVGFCISGPEREYVDGNIILTYQIECQHCHDVKYMTFNSASFPEPRPNTINVTLSCSCGNYLENCPFTGAF